MSIIPLSSRCVITSLTVSEASLRRSISPGLGNTPDLEPKVEEKQLPEACGFCVLPIYLSRLPLFSV